MAPRYVALLRGINVGRAKRVAMADLRSLAESLGWKNVRTLLNSGNVVFEGGAPERSTSATWRAASVTNSASRPRSRFSAPIPSRRSTRRTSSRRVATSPSRLLICVWRDHPESRKRLVRLARKDWGEEMVHLGSRAIYVWSPEGVLASESLKAIEETLESALTSRNASTWARILAALSSA